MTSGSTEHPTGTGDPYPLTFSVDRPDRPLDRLSTAFRIILIIPIAILLATLEGGSFAVEAGNRRNTPPEGSVSFPSGPAHAMREVPRWWYDWNLQLTRFSNRHVYLALMDDRYPSTDEEQAVHLDPVSGRGTRASRGMPLVKCSSRSASHPVLPRHRSDRRHGHRVVRDPVEPYPRSLFTYVEGVLRW